MAEVSPISLFHELVPIDFVPDGFVLNDKLEDLFDSFMAT